MFHDRCAACRAAEAVQPTPLTPPLPRNPQPCGAQQHPRPGACQPSLTPAVQLSCTQHRHKVKSTPVSSLTLVNNAPVVRHTRPSPRSLARVQTVTPFAAAVSALHSSPQRWFRSVLCSCRTLPTLSSVVFRPLALTHSPCGLPSATLWYRQWASPCLRALSPWCSKSQVRVCAARPFLEPAESLLTAPAGDAVSVDEVIAQIETDKVTMDVRAPAAGVVDTIKVCPCPVDTPCCVHAAHTHTSVSRLTHSSCVSHRWL